MKATFLGAALIAAASLFTGVPSAQAGPIERACLQSDRTAATRTLCRCIQTAADRTLTQSQQRRGAQFFSNPQVAQDVRQSDRASDARLWESWRNFGATAEALCS